MNMEMLKDSDIPASVIDQWRKDLGDELLPVQARAVMKHRVLEGQSLVVFSPTSSGKTFVGEMAAVAVASKKRRVFYLVPLKAIAHEKYEEFKNRYRETDLNIVLSTRDFSKDDERIRQEDFTIAILVYEKLSSLLVSSPHLLDAAGLVVVDELQMLADETRGASLEVLLTKLLLARNPPQILGLSAVLGNASEIAQWLGAEVLMEKKRPVELRKGIFRGDTFHYQEHNNENNQGAERLLPFRADKEEDALQAVAVALSATGDGTLVFLPDRSSTLKFAQKLIAKVNLPPAFKALEEIKSYEPSTAREYLEEMLQHGVAFHNSDLSWEYRAVVEQAFRSGEVKVLATTSTLSMGMNLPCANVLITRRKWVYDLRYGKWHKDDLTRMEFENMAGRAGRYGQVGSFGRAIMVADNEFDLPVLQKFYLSREYEKIHPALAGMGVEEQVLNIIASQLVRTEQQVFDLLFRSFTGQEVFHKRMSSQATFQRSVSEAIAKCCKAGVVTQDEEGILKVSPEGKIAAMKGLKVKTAAAMLHFITQLGTKVPRHGEILLMLVQTPDGENAYLNMAGEEKDRGVYLREFRSRVTKCGLQEHPAFESFFQKRAYDFEEHKRLKKVLMLLDWIQEVQVRTIEQTYRVWDGTIRRLAEDFAWLADALGMMMIARDFEGPILDEVQSLANRLFQGVKDGALALGDLKVRGLGRVSLRRLLDAGLQTPVALANTPLKELGEILQNGPLATRLLETLSIYGITQECVVANEQTASDQTVPLIIDPFHHTITFHGVLVDLPHQGFRLVQYLAEHPDGFQSASLLMKDVWKSRDWQVDQKAVHEQVRVVRDVAEAAFRQAAKNPDLARELILTKKKAGYRLNVSKEAIQVLASA